MSSKHHKNASIQKYVWPIYENKKKKRKMTDKKKEAYKGYFNEFGKKKTGKKQNQLRSSIKSD